MKNKIRLTATAGVLAMCGVASLFAASPQPNIVHILTDDLGWQDVACYYRAEQGKESIYETPNMDRMAQNGMRFMQAYSPAPTCAPSRAAYLSGRTTLRTGVYHVLGGWPVRARTADYKYIDPAYSGRLPMDAPTIANALKASGYVTAHIQKMHVGGIHHGYPGPLDYGFDFSWTTGAGMRYNDPELWDPSDKKRANYHGIWAPLKPRHTNFPTSRDPNALYSLDENDRPFDSVVDLTLRWMDKVHDDGKPFFVNFCPSFVHGPIATRDRKRLEYYCKKMGYEFPTDPGRLSDQKKGQVNPYYAAMIDTLDWQIGQIVAFLEATDDPRNPGHKLIDNTYIMVSSDNGGSVHGPTTTGTESCADNSPLRDGKKSMFEGGLRIPFIVQGPGIEAGSVNQIPINLIDMLPTYVAMAGQNDWKDLDVDGCNVLPVMLGQEKVVLQANGRVRDTMLYSFPIEHVGSSVIRKGDWKLILNHVPEMNRLPEVQLYRIYNADGSACDLSERNNLVESHPEKTKALREELEAWLTKYESPLPYKNAQLARNPHPDTDKVPAVVEKTSDGATIRVRVETGVDKARIVEARLIYTTNGSDELRTNKNYEEWFPAPATVLADGAEAAAPPGMTHGILYLRDENGFMVASENMEPRMTPGSDIWAKGTEFIQDGYAFRPGLIALIETGRAAQKKANNWGKRLIGSGQNVSDLSQALLAAEQVVAQPVEEKTYSQAMRDLRSAIRALDVPEARLDVLNQFKAPKWAAQ
jgi:arylsulfatase A-like enzyme